MRTSDFVERYGRYVHKLARQLLPSAPPGIELSDLVALGYVGLLEAAKRFDERAGVQFITFAHYRIKGAMLDGMRRARILEPCPDPVDEAVQFRDPVAASELRSDLLRALAGLTQRERVLLRDRVLNELTQRQAGSAVGISKSWSCLLIRRAMSKARRAL